MENFNKNPEKENPESDNSEMELDEIVIENPEYQNIEDSKNYKSDMDTLNNTFNEVPLYIKEAFSYHTDSIQSVSVNPIKSTEIISGGLDDKFNLIEIETGKNLFSETFKETVAFVSFNFDGTLMIACTLDNLIHIFINNENYEKKFTLEGPSEEITSLSMHPKANCLMLSSKDSTLWVWNLNNGKLLKTFYGHSEGINKCSFTPNGKQMCSVSDDGTMKIWKIGQDQPFLNFQSTKEKSFHLEPITDLSFHELQPIVATASLDETFCISNYENGQIYSKSDKLGEIQTIQIGSSFNALILGTLQGELNLYDLNTLSKLSQLKHKSGIILSKFWNQRKLFVSITATGEIIMNGFGSFKDHKINEILKEDYLHDFAFIDENLVLLGGEDSYLYLYDIRKGLIDENIN